MESKRTQNMRSLRIARERLLVQMGRPIDLDYRLAGDRDEIDNVAIDWLLPPKFPAFAPWT
jgi:hypothetical protein